MISGDFPKSLELNPAHTKLQEDLVSQSSDSMGLSTLLAGGPFDRSSKLWHAWQRGASSALLARAIVQCDLRNSKGEIRKFLNGDSSMGAFVLCFLENPTFCSFSFPEVDPFLGSGTVAYLSSAAQEKLVRMTPSTLNLFLESPTPPSYPAMRSFFRMMESEDRILSGRRVLEAFEQWPSSMNLARRVFSFEEKMYGILDQPGISPQDALTAIEAYLEKVWDEVFLDDFLVSFRLWVSENPKKHGIQALRSGIQKSVEDMFQRIRSSGSTSSIRVLSPGSTSSVVSLDNDLVTVLPNAELENLKDTSMREKQQKILSQEELESMVKSQARKLAGGLFAADQPKAAEAVLKMAQFTPSYPDLEKRLDYLATLERTPKVQEEMLRLRAEWENRVDDSLADILGDSSVVDAIEEFENSLREESKRRVKKMAGRKIKSTAGIGTGRWSLRTEEDEKEKRKMSLKEQGKEAMGAVGQGMKLAVANEAGEVLVDIAKELTAEMPAMQLMLQHQDGKEIAKLLMALLIQTGAEQTDMIPDSEFVAEACKLQMTAASYTLVGPRLNKLRKHFTKLAKVGARASGKVLTDTEARARIADDLDIEEEFAEMRAEMAEEMQKLKKLRAELQEVDAAPKAAKRTKAAG